METLDLPPRAGRYAMFGIGTTKLILLGIVVLYFTMRALLQDANRQ